MKIRVIVTGVTGIVGEGVLHEYLQHPGVEQVPAVNRRPCGIPHPELTEIIQVRDIIQPAGDHVFHQTLQDQKRP